jgi:hypothetical protein
VPGRGGGDLADLRAQAGHVALRLREVPGRAAELGEFGVGAVEVGRRGQVQHGDGERGQPLGEVPGVAGRDDQVRLVRDDGLDVRGQPAQLRLRHPGWVVGVLVDRPDLPPGADRVQHFSGGR